MHNQQTLNVLAEVHHTRLVFNILRATTDLKLGRMLWISQDEAQVEILKTVDEQESLKILASSASIAEVMNSSKQTKSH